MQEFSKLFGAFNIADFIPWLGWVHANEFNRRLARARESLDGFIDTIIDDHLAKKTGNMEGKLDGDVADTDMVDKLMAFYSEEDVSSAKKYVDDSQSGFKITRDNIKALIMWELPDGMKPSELDMEDMFGLTAPRAVQLVAVPSYRLSCPLKV
ncbi:hypothetical protein Q3G72_015490 [Acer saccharum]|nr:hypothetical protein Q3G72_015490 [Acer saccharum]